MDILTRSIILIKECMFETGIEIDYLERSGANIQQEFNFCLSTFADQLDYFLKLMSVCSIELLMSKVGQISIFPFLLCQGTTVSF